MTSRLQKQIAIDAAWFFGVLLVGGLVLGGTLKKLGEQRSRVDSQQRELSAKETRLTDEASARERLSDLAVATNRLEESDALISEEASRISLISSIANSSNMEVVSVRSGTERATTDPSIVAQRHELIAVGDFRDLARFIDALQAAPGSVAIDAVEVTRAKVAPAPPTRRRFRNAAPVPQEPEVIDTRLRVSLEVIWLGVSPDFDALQEEKKKS